ncbi:MAG: maleylpyruvate isomerase N-terminal domain-containing protein, partial [Roseiflexaceae bacterium]
MTDRMSVAELTARIRVTSTRMELLLSQLSVEQFNQSGAVGLWSVKDVLVHIAFWERHAVNMLKAVARGKTPDLLADDSTERSNASVVAQYYQRPLAAVIADW